ncbi:hypothetical protein ACE102_03135 [Bradyrhizobium sp. vgs-9]|uniref:hypothetical protein n=1 Tax=Bradyrhizobium sp. vgs-9 TaxID=208389 RepID=UPI0035D495F8
MIAIEALIQNAIVIYASAEHIAREREQLEKWRADELAAIPGRARTISELMGGCDTVQRVSIPAAELFKVKERAAEELRRYGAPLPPAAIELRDALDVENAYLSRMSDLYALERRSSDASLQPRPAKPVRRDLH